MLKKLSIIILVAVCNAYSAAETTAKRQAESGRRTSALLDHVTPAKDLQALILGYLGYLNSWMLDRTITLQDPHYSALARHFVRHKSPDGTYIASSYRDRFLKGGYYKNEGYEVVRDSISILESATQHVTEKLIVFGGEDFGHVGAPSGLDLITWSPDGKQVAFCWGSSTIHMWDVKSRTVKLFNPPRLSPCSDKPRATSLVFSPDGQQLAFGLCDSTIIILDVATAKEFKTNRLTDWCKSPSVYKIGEPSASNSRTTEIFKRLSGHAGSVLSVSWSPDGKQLASGSQDNTIIIWDAATGQLIKKLSGHRNQIDSVVWSPDGTCVASSSSWDATIKIWDLKTEESTTLPCKHVKSVAWSHDGRRLFSRSSNTVFGEDAAIQIWKNQIEDLGSAASEAPAAPACRQASACTIM